MRFSLYLVLALTLAACGESDANPDAGAGGDGGAGGGGGTADPGVWEACGDGPGECAVFEVPLDWEDPEGEQLPYFVRRFPSDAPGAVGQLWLLVGGPGAAGWGLYDRVDLFQRLAPGFDVYVPDYRGVGHSSWLGCAGSPGTVVDEDCSAELLERWGERLRHFTTTAAARDLGHTIEALRGPDEAVFVFGNSYGTFVANRYLTLFPDQADAAVLDSVCAPGGCDLRTDRNLNLIAEEVFGMCDADAFCSSKLAGGWDRFLALLDSFEGGHCSAFFGYPGNREVVGTLALLLSSQPNLLAAVPPMVYRAERCNDADVAALRQLHSVFYSTEGLEAPPPPGEERSIYLSNQVVFSEFWPEGLDRAAATVEVEALPAQLGYLLGWIDRYEAWTWPLVDTPDELVRWADTDTPVLLLNGRLDPLTHVAVLDEAAEAFSGPGQQAVPIVMSSHSTIFASGPGVNDPSLTCGAELVADFFADPAGELDTRCADLADVNFEDDGEIARWLFDTSDPWENEVALAGARTASPKPATARAIEQVRAKIREATPR